MAHVGRHRPISWRGHGLRPAAELVLNRLVTHIPVNAFHIASLRALGAEIGPAVFLFSSSEFLAPQNLRIAGGLHLGRYCQLDARGGISIGRNVVIASHTLLITADHDPDDPGFSGRLGRISIGDRAWLGSRVLVLRGVTVGEGAVVSAGSVVTRDVDPWTVVAGNPAKIVRQRAHPLRYEISDGPQFY